MQMKCSLRNVNIDLRNVLEVLDKVLDVHEHV